MPPAARHHNQEQQHLRPPAAQREGTAARVVMVTSGPKARTQKFLCWFEPLQVQSFCDLGSAEPSQQVLFLLWFQVIPRFLSLLQQNNKWWVFSILVLPGQIGSPYGVFSLPQHHSGNRPQIAPLPVCERRHRRLPAAAGERSRGRGLQRGF